MNDQKGVFIFFGCGLLFLIGSLIAGAIDGVGFMLVASILAVFASVVSAKMKKTETAIDGQPKNADSSAQISRLHELLKSGALTQDEFDAEKRKVLGRAA
jgi:hypothetical protein